MGVYFSKEAIFMKGKETNKQIFHMSTSRNVRECFFLRRPRSMFRGVMPASGEKCMSMHGKMSLPDFGMSKKLAET